MKIRIYSAGASWNECKVCDQSCVADDSNISMTRTSQRNRFPSSKGKQRVENEYLLWT